MPRRPKPPPATVAVFVRHGLTPTTGKALPGRARGLHLSDDGRAQADAVGDRLAALKRVDAIYSSPLERARETAGAIGRRLKIKVGIDKGLLECDFGDWTGAELKAVRKLPEWEAVQRHPSGFRFPNGESFHDMQARMAQAVARLRGRHPGQTIVLVSHADPIKTAVADATGIPLDLFQRLVISPCSVTAIAYSDSGPTVLTVNSLGDLAELRPS